MMPAAVPLRGPQIFRYKSKLALLALGVVLLAAAVNLAVVQDQDPYDGEIAKGNDLLRRHRWEDALKSFKHANELHDKKSVEASLGMIQAYYGLDAFKNVVDTCEKILEMSAGDGKTMALAYNYEGIALQALANVKDQKKLAEAEAMFRKGVALNTDLPILHYNLGFSLLEMNRDDEGIAELKKYISLSPEGSKAAEAAKLIANPRRAREAFAPDFSLTTADGELVSLDDLRGKVVLLDFWATWCGPCVASVPALRDLQKKFAKDPQFKMISVSTDRDEAQWHGFLEKNQMVWAQYIDRDHHMAGLFNVHTFPTYILLDAEGVIRYREVSSSWERTGDLPDAIKKYLKQTH